MKKFFKLSLILLVVFFIAACASHPFKLTEYSDTSKIESEYEILPRVKVTTNGFALFGIIPLGFKSREMRAKRDILEISGGTDIINPSVSSRYTWTPIGPIVRFTLEATPIKKKSNTSTTN